MKYLFLLIRHMFPRKRWVTTRETGVIDNDGVQIGIILTQTDQFGNLRTKTIGRSRHSFL